MNIKKLIIHTIILGGSAFFMNGLTFAQNTNPLCSITARGEKTQTFQDLYKPNTIQKATINSISSTLLASIIKGDTRWYNNFDICGTIGDADGSEVGAWNSFWGDHAKKIPGGVASYNSKVIKTDAIKLQNYINKYCGLGLTPDGQIGIKTLNAVKICRPVANLTQQKFETLAPDLSVDSAGTKKIYNISTQKIENIPTSPIYVDPKKSTPAQAATDGLVLAKTTDEGNLKEQNGGNGCKGLTDGYTFVDTNFSNPTEGYEADCSCKPKYKKVSKTIKNEKGVTQNISVCEKCDPIKCNCGVKLNTDIPFIGSCLMYGNTNNINENGDGTTTVNGINAFPILMGALIRLLVSIILIISFGTIIVGGFMMTIPEQFKTGKDLVIKVVWTIASLGSLGIILYLINPNFFK